MHQETFCTCIPGIASNRFSWYTNDPLWSHFSSYRRLFSSPSTVSEPQESRKGGSVKDTKVHSASRKQWTVAYKSTGSISVLKSIRKNPKLSFPTDQPSEQKHQDTVTVLYDLKGFHLGNEDTVWGLGQEWKAGGNTEITLGNTEDSTCLDGIKKDNIRIIRTDKCWKNDQ